MIIRGDEFLGSGSVKYSSLVNKDLRKMICHMKCIFVWVFLIPQPTGNVFIWDFVVIFLVFTFFFRIRNSIGSSYNVLYLGDFYLDSSRLRCF